MEGEDKIKLYDTQEVQLKKLIFADKSSYEWRGDGKVLITLKKQNGPSFWKYLLEDSVQEVKELQVWWDMRDKYIEQLEEYMMEENIKEKSSKKAAASSKPIDEEL